MREHHVIRIITICSLLLISIGLSAKDAAWNYEIEGLGTGVEGTYLVKVTVIAKNPAVSDAELVRCAVHGVLFRGFVSQKDRQHQRPMVGANAESQHETFFTHFFDGDLSPYAQAIAGSRQVSMAEKKYRVSASVQVFKETLRQAMEQQGIAPTMTMAEAKKPTLMVVPANSWCTEHGYSDYEQALDNNMDLVNVITKIGELMAERQFPMKDLSQTIKSLRQDRTEDELLTSSTSGAMMAESAIDKLYKRAKADIILEMAWQVNNIGPKRSVTYTLRGLDAYTNKQVAAAQGTGSPSLATELPVLLEEAVLENMDNFLGQLQNHFTDLLDHGREVSIGVRIFDDGSGLSFGDEYEGELLTDIIEEWMSEHTVGHCFNLVDATETMLNFEQVRIPVYNKSGRAQDTRNFVGELRKYLKSEYNIASKIVTKGLGRAELILEGQHEAQETKVPAKPQPQANHSVELMVADMEQGDKVPQSVVNQLQVKLIHALTANGVVSTNDENQFFMAGRFSHAYIETVPGPPVQVAVHTVLTLYIGDVKNKKIFASQNFDLRGVGENEERAFLHALSEFNAKDAVFVDFVNEGKNKIVDYCQKHNIKKASPKTVDRSKNTPQQRPKVIIDFVRYK